MSAARLKLALAAILALPAVCPAAAVSDTGEPSTATTALRPALLPLDDPANPYRGFYSAVDHWLADWWQRTAIEDLDGPVAGKEFDVVASNLTLGTPQMSEADVQGEFVSIYADVQGCMLPYGRRRWHYLPELTPQLALDFYLAPRLLDDEEPVPVGRVPVAAVPDEIRQQMTWFRQCWELLHIPRIPAWLGTRPPLSAVFMDNGEILCQGELGLHYGPRELGDGPRPNWYRYAPDGRLLGVLRGDREDDPRLDSFSCSDLALYAPWFELYWPAMQDDLAQHFTHEGVVAQAWGSWLVVAEKNASNDAGCWPAARPIASYAYDGRRLADDEPLGGLQIAPSRLSQFEIARLYRQQVQSGFTDPESFSPWEGGPEGPVTTDPTVLHLQHSSDIWLCRPLDGLRR